MARLPNRPPIFPFPLQFMRGAVTRRRASQSRRSLHPCSFNLDPSPIRATFRPCADVNARGNARGNRSSPVGFPWTPAPWINTSLTTGIAACFGESRLHLPPTIDSVPRESYHQHRRLPLTHATSESRNLLPWTPPGSAEQSESPPGSACYSKHPPPVGHPRHSFLIKTHFYSLFVLGSC